jgi:hypothetical protein
MAKQMSRIANSAEDPYLARIVKLIPSEVIAAYLAIGNLIPGLDSGHLEHAADWWSLAIFWIATPFALHASGRVESPPKSPSVTHYVVSMLAFPIWAFNVAGTVTVYGLPFNHALAGILMVLFTFISELMPV